jgi:hypothetical protein
VGFTAIDPTLEAALSTTAASAAKAIVTPSSGALAAEEKIRNRREGKKKPFIILKLLGLASLLQEVKDSRYRDRGGCCAGTASTWPPAQKENNTCQLYREVRFVARIRCTGAK